MSSKKIIKQCVRCKRLLDEKKQIWSKAEGTKKIISSFNNDSFLSVAFDRIEFEEIFCPECQKLLPDMSPEKFREYLVMSE